MDREYGYVNCIGAIHQCDATELNDKINSATPAYDVLQLDSYHTSTLQFTGYYNILDFTTQ